MTVTSVSHTRYLSDHRLRRAAQRARRGVKIQPDFAIIEKM